MQARNFHIDGTILKMDFLRAPSDDEDLVILLFVVSMQGITQFLHYEWDSSKDLRTLQSTGQGHPTTKEGQTPLLLIPFSISTGFILISEQAMTVYHNILADPTDYDETRRSKMDLPDEPGSSKNWPLWTAWTRLTRREEYSTGKESLFLCREDGLVRLLEFSYEKLREHGVSSVGKLHINVDTAFAALDNGIGFDDGIERDSADALVAAGDMSEGGVFIFKARRNGRLEQPLPNWAPVLDFTTAHTFPDTASEGSSRLATTLSGPRGSERVFACVGRGQKQGAICEIRVGTEARLSLEFDADPTVRAMWILPNLSNSGVQILLTYSNQRSEFFDYDFEVDETRDTDSGINTDAMTLAASTTIEGVAIQICEDSIRARIPRAGAIFEPIMENRRITRACIDGRSSVFLIADRDGDGTKLRAGLLTLAQDTDPPQVHLKGGNPLLIPATH